MERGFQNTPFFKMKAIILAHLVAVQTSGIFKTLTKKELLYNLVTFFPIILEALL